MTMISDLPADLVQEILSRVQASSLKFVRSTCKQWNALVKKNQRFTEKHIREAAKQSMILILKDYRIFPVTINLDVAASSIEFKSALLSPKVPHSNSQEVDIADVFYCEGLLLCTTKDKRLVVWNPYLGETRWIQVPFKPEHKRDPKFFLGYQNNKSGRSYKILRCWYLKEYETYHVARFQIYDLSSDSWKVLDSVFLNWSTQLNTGISLKGNTYWIASDEGYAEFLVSFDFTKEIFKRLSLPPVQRFDGHMMTPSVVREEQLLMIDGNISNSKMVIWMTSNIDVVGEADLMWSKYFTVKVPNPGRYSPISVSYIIDEEKKVVVCGNERPYKTKAESMVVIIGKDRRYHTKHSYVESKNPGWSIIFSCVPSLSNPAR